MDGDEIPGLTPADLRWSAARVKASLANAGWRSPFSELTEAGKATVAAESTAVATGTEVAGETLLGTAAETGLEVGGTVGAAGGFEIPVWGWIATGVAAAAGTAYGIYKYYQHKHQAASVPQENASRRHFNKAQLLEVQHIVTGTATAGEVKDVQQELKAEGFDIGKYGKKHDGVDGIAGRHTRDAMRAAMERLDSPSSP
jgi:hypothetical protein